MALTRAFWARYTAGPAEIAGLKSRVDLLRDGGEQVTARYGDVMPGGGGSSDTVAMIVMRREAAQAQLRERQLQHLDDMKQVVDAVLAIPHEVERAAAWACYVVGLTREEARTQMHYSESNFRSLINRARAQMVEDE